MDENEVAAIKKELNPPSAQDLTAELYNPLAFIPPNKLRTTQKRKRRSGIIKVGVGIGVPIFSIIMDKILPGQPSTGTYQSKAAMGGLLLGAILIYLTLRGIYELMTINIAIAQERRSALLSLQPKLLSAETERRKVQKDNPWPKRVMWIIITSPLWYTILVFVLQWLGWVTFKS